MVSVMITVLVMGMVQTKQGDSQWGWPERVVACLQPGDTPLEWSAPPKTNGSLERASGRRADREEFRCEGDGNQHRRSRNGSCLL